MAGRPVVIEWQDSAEALAERVRNEPNAHLARRWQALHMLRTGLAVSDAATRIGVAYRTVEYWLSWYRAGGAAEVVRHRRGRRTSGATDAPTNEQIQDLLNEARTNGFESQRAAIAWMAERHGVAVTPGAMSRLFRNASIRRRLPPAAIAKLSYHPAMRLTDMPAVTRAVWRLPMRGDTDFHLDDVSA